MKINDLIKSSVVVCGLLSPSAHASLVTGTATLSINNSAFDAATGWYAEQFFGAGFNNTAISGSSTGGTVYGTTDTLSDQLTVNTNSANINNTSINRRVEATTLDTGNLQVGQIGLSGAFLLDPDPTNTAYAGSYLTAYDFRVVDNSGQWFIQSYDKYFGYTDFLQLVNVTQSVDANGNLSLSGSLEFTSDGWGSLLGANTSTIVGAFSLSPAAVPLPASVWMFGASLLGFVAARVRGMAQSA